MLFLTAFIFTERRVCECLPQVNDKCTHANDQMKPVLSKESGQRDESSNIGYGEIYEDHGAMMTQSQRRDFEKIGYECGY